MISKHAMILIGELERSVGDITRAESEDFTIGQYKEATYKYSKAHKELKEYVESLERLVGEAK